MNETDLGVALNLLLEARGFSAWQLSRQADVKEALVSAALSGSGSVPIAAWCRLARALEHKLTLAPAPPVARPVGPIESVVDLALRRLGEPYSVGAEPVAAGGGGSGDVSFDELDELANATFGSAEEATGWLRRPHPMLDGHSPFEYAKSGPGAKRVKDMLVAIRHGGAV